MLKLVSPSADHVVQRFQRRLQHLSRESCRTPIFDHGEKAAQNSFALATNTAVFLCDQQNPWQRGNNKNTNGPLRQSLPKRKIFPAVRNAS
jgi:IS30 family transposase